MLAGPDATLETMIAAVADTIHALDAAAELDLDRTAADRKFFAAKQKILAPLLVKLVAARRAIEDHDIGEGSRLQTRVEIGDQVLDRGVSDGNARTKLAVKGKAGLDATHVFGKNVATLTKEKIALEPQKVLEAMDRMTWAWLTPCPAAAQEPSPAITNIERRAHPGTRAANSERTNLSGKRI